MTFKKENFNIVNVNVWQRFDSKLDETKKYLMELDDGNIILMKKGEDELVEAINKVIAEINESGIYEQWTEEAQALAETLGIDEYLI